MAHSAAPRCGLFNVWVAMEAREETQGSRCTAVGGSSGQCCLGAAMAVLCPGRNMRTRAILAYSADIANGAGHAGKTIAMVRRNFCRPAALPASLLLTL